MNVIDVLKRAREILNDSDKWTKGSYQRRGGEYGDQYKYCLMGACYKADVSTGSALVPIRSALLGCIPSDKKLTGSFLDVESFNDDPDTTHQMILDLLDCAISKGELDVAGS